ncbi:MULTISPECIES: ABC transporter substrate-binding protein [Bacillus cereus group]|jgi:peptide/nickel transport system substrate-binding protein|uniref:ABC transporter substrate-binding protein n=1 Tax=Bacillus cereus group TaxID=86661 RepID=UPI001581015E|nr:MULTISPECIES: ABC transporter substrate-binding protein [Bacillus cereus group]NUH91420.1 ABC transporter substrate-binding protein [Bacillus thuringiensis]NUH96773.1 ABC transporter substrate-binding protein [Bacillus thuringiensis]NUI02080.1 ABC transporter substrate-binding protein [Bacillus thuringiensis]NUI07303.1 ABC transporter substrate-binding protein [Bacillus thuringiensis]NUI15312.1 ABC transporter substrate-binding protein [Bacillus thuringiensis]
MKKKTKKWAGVFSVLMSSSLVLSACGGQEDAASTEPVKQQDLKNVKIEKIAATDKTKVPDKAKNRKDTLVVGISKPGGVFLPYFQQNGWDGNVTSVIFASLVSTDKQGKPIPELAEKWDVSSDQLTYTFHLRKDLKFSDGSPLTADDVAFTLTLLHDKAYEGEVDISQYAVKGGKEYKEGKATSIEGIQVVDPQTIKITTEKVNSQAIFVLGGTVLSKAYYGKDYKQNTSLDYLKDLYGNPLAAGPYKFEKYIPGQEVRFVANENYYAGKPKIQNFIYKITSGDTKLQLFQTGEVDHTGLGTGDEVLEQAKALEFANIQIETAPSFSYIYMNNNKPYLKDKKVRQALIYGLDRKKYVDTALKGYGTVANVPIHPTSWAYTEEGVNKYEYDKEKAKKLLDEAGWKVGSDGIREKDGQKLKLSYFGPSSAKDSDLLIPIAKENYKEIGVEFNPEFMDFNTMLSKVNKGDYDLASVSTPITSDPSETAGEYLSTANETSLGYKNAKVDELIQKGIETVDIEKRKPIYKELYKELSDDPPVILLNYRRTITGYNGNIKGIDPEKYNSISANLPVLSFEK